MSYINTIGVCSKNSILDFFSLGEDNINMGDHNMDSTLKSLQQSYIEKDFKSGIDLMLKEKAKFSQPIFHFNVGTLYVKEGNLAAGRFHLEKALQKGWIDGKIYSNLKHVKKNLNVVDIDSSTNFFDKAVAKSLDIPVDLYLTFTLLFTFLLLLLKKLKFIKNTKTFVVLLFLSFVPYFYQTFYTSKLNYGVALEELSILEGPSSIFEKKGLLEAGAKVMFGKQEGDFIYIKFPYFLSGWVKKSSVALY